MDVRVLGPVEVTDAGASLQLVRRQQRLILGILALAPTRVVSRERLVELLWGYHPPGHARAIIQSRVSELRSALTTFNGAEMRRALATVDGGYKLDIRPDLVDAHRFRQLVCRARAAEQPEARRAVLRAALALWRGPVLGGGLCEEAYAALCQGLESARLTAWENLFEVELALGNHQQVVDEMLEVATSHPAREYLTMLLMKALHCSGRTAEALTAYQRCRQWLCDELGIEPGEALQELYLTMLRSSPRQAGSPRPPAAGSPPPGGVPAGVEPAALAVTVPRLLPPDTSDFTGRFQEIAQLTTVLSAKRAGRIAVAAVAGRAGVGKTALCVRVAYLLRHEYPDGQLFADLREVEGNGIASPFTVLGRFLRALGVDGRAMPETLDERVDLYRTLLSDRRVMVVLDDAARPDQIVPLIPGGPMCAVLISGRARFGAAVSAHTIDLDVLSSAHAAKLLARLAGDHRVRAEPDAAARLCQLCGHLPLAVRIVGAKLAAKPHWRLTKMVGLLSDEQRRLDHFAHGRLDVRASIAVSYREVADPVQRLLRTLGDLALPQVTVWSAAAVLDAPVKEAEEMLEQLFDAQLLAAAGRDTAGHTRYQLHDLVRLFAGEQAAGQESRPARDAARDRAIHSWYALIEVAYRAVFGGDYLRIRGEPPHWRLDRSVVDGVVADPLRWIEAEEPTILGIIRLATRSGQVGLSWGLACVASQLAAMRNPGDEWLRVLADVRAAAIQAGDARGHAAALYRIGMLCVERQEFPQAWEHFRRAAMLLLHAGDQHGQALMTAFAAMGDRWRGRHDLALARYRDVLPLLRDHADHGGQAYVLRSIAEVHLKQGDLAAAAEHLDQAWAVSCEIGSARIAAQVLLRRGMLQIRQAQWRDARRHLVDALTRTREIGDRSGEAETLYALALCHRGEGELDRAERTLLDAIGMVPRPHPTRTRSRLCNLLAEIRGDTEGTGVEVVPPPQPA